MTPHAANTLTPNQLRQVRTAAWHAQEALLHTTKGDTDKVDYHVEAGREFLELATGVKSKAENADELIAACLQTVDMGNVVLLSC